MKPLNLNKESCSPVSSNCVIWQGPDIECINLCKGDSVTEVVHKLATELCTLMDTFNIDNYDLSCFNLLECEPKDFAALIQFLIEKVCACCNETPTVDSTGTLGCPDCEVEVCSAFYYDSPRGDVQTTMQLKDYVETIGNRLCQIIGQIDTINSTLNNHETRITTLENAPAPGLTLPQVTPDCVLPATPTNMDVVLDALEEQFCELRTATGDPQAIYLAMLNQCAGLNSLDQLSGSGTMSDINGWNASVSNLSQSMTNMWLTLCDIRAAVFNIQNTCCDTGCDGIDINMVATIVDSTTLNLVFTGTVPPNFSDCSGGSTIQLSNPSPGSSTTISLNVISSYLNDLSGYDLDLSGTGLVTDADITAILTLCAIDNVSGTTCQNVSISVAGSTTDCPTVILTPALDSIQYNMTYTGSVSNSPVEVRLYNQAQTVLLSSTVYPITTSPQAIAGSFTGLTSGTDYYVTVVIGSAQTACPFELVTTLNSPCLPPTGVSATLIP